MIFKTRVIFTQHDSNMAFINTLEFSGGPMVKLVRLRFNPTSALLCVNCSITRSLKTFETCNVHLSTFNGSSWGRMAYNLLTKKPGFFRPAS